MVLLILVLLNKLILLFLIYGVIKFMILIFVFKILVFLFKLWKLGGNLWIGMYFFVFILFRLFIGLFKMFNMCFNIFLFIGILIGDSVLIIFIL